MDKKPQAGVLMRYQVERHSGRYPSEFRMVLDTDDFEKAQAEYDTYATALRQGSVRLLIDGAVARVIRAPRLRTHW